MRLCLQVLVATPLAALAVLILPVPAPGQGVDEVWTASCARCHGDQGQGGGAGTRTLLDEVYTTSGSDRELFEATKHGRQDGGMPPFGATMSDEQIWALTVYIRELQARAKRERTGSPQADERGVYPSQHHRYRIETVIEQGLDTPWAVDFPPGRDGAPGPMLVTNRSGALQVWTVGTLSPPLAGTPRVRNQGQGGLMDVAVHPDYPLNGWVYLTYSDELETGESSPGMTKVVRGKLAGQPGTQRWVDQQTVFEAKHEHYMASNHHFGSRIAFQKAPKPGPSGAAYYLYFTLGERGRMENAQELALPNGKAHRLWDDGTIPDDNPFSARSEEAYASIWTYGNRNPQGLAFDLEGNLWATEHGPRGGDELNLLLPGKNSGWPLVSHGINYTGAPFRTPWPDLSTPNLATDAVAMPVFHWLPSIAACGLDVVRPGPLGETFPQWRGDLLAGGLGGETVQRLRLEPDPGAPLGKRVAEREEILHGLGRVRDVAVGLDGSVYVVLNGPDKVIRLVRPE